MPREDEKYLTGGMCYNKSILKCLNGAEGIFVSYIGFNTEYVLLNSIKSIFEYQVDAIIIPSTLIKEILLLIFFKRQLKIIVVLQEQDWKFGKLKKLKPFIYRLALKRTYKIIVCSYKLKDLLISDFNFHESSIHVINPPVEANGGNNLDFSNVINKRINKLNLLCVSRIEERKNILFMLMELAKISLEDYHLYIAGSIYKHSLYTKKVLGFVKANNLQDKVTFLGNINKNELDAFYKHSDLLIHPADIEAFGMGMIESLQSGCPVFCSDKTTKEITTLPGVSTFKVNSFSSDLIACVNNLKKIKSVTVKNKPKVISNFSLNIFCRKIRNIL